MKIQPLFTFIFTFGALFVSCQSSVVSPISSQKSFGQVEIDFGNLKTQAGSFQSETGIVINPIASAVVCTDATSNVRYIYRSFTVTNTTGSSLENLQLHAYKKLGNVNSSALKNIVDFGGNTNSSLVSSVQPRHGLGSCTTAPFAPDPAKADLQVYSSAEITARTTSAGTNLDSGELLLGYGYLARQRGAQSVSDSDDRTIANNESATVTIGLKVPNTANSVYSFSMTFLLFTDMVRELVQTPEDVLAGTTAGLAALPVGTARVSLLGGAACGLSGNNRYQKQIVIADTGSTQRFDAETQNPAGAVIVISSNADSGLGSLRTAISDAQSIGIFCFTQPIALNSSLVIDKNIYLLAGENAALNGTNSTTGIISVSSSGNLCLYSVTVENGRDTNGTGGGIKNAGTTTLFGTRVQNNRAAPSTQGGAAQGGGIQNSGTLTLQYSKISSNIAQGADTTSVIAAPSNDVILNGEVGGHARGGGIYSTNAVTLQSSLVSNNAVLGGKGANGFDAYDFGADRDCDGRPGNGGNGGDALGGGVYLGTGGTLNGAALVSGNLYTSGIGGSPGNIPVLALRDCILFAGTSGALGLGSNATANVAP